MDKKETGNNDKKDPKNHPNSVPNGNPSGSQMPQGYPSMNMFYPPPGYTIPPGYPYYPPPPNAAWPLPNGYVPVQNYNNQMPPPNVISQTASTSNPYVANAPWHKTNSNIPVRPSYSNAVAGQQKVNVTVTKTTQTTTSKASVAPIPVAHQSKPPAAAVAPKEEWSSSVKTYVERAFLACKTPAERDIMEQILRLKIKEAIATDKMSKIKWEIEPIPSLPKSSSSAPLNATNIVKPVTPKATVLNEEEKKRLERAKRFESDQKAFKKQQHQNQLALQNVRIEDNLGDVIDWDEYTIVGTCQKLEKPYLRLTAAPDPATVRPLPVLKQALKMLKDKWRTGCDYGYICDQFKSLRQDMTVQRIKSDFTIQVYEIHARIAIEQGDLGQYNQCQTQLKDLYGIGLNGSEMEFLSYRLLYLIHCKNKQAINQVLSELSDEHRANPAVSHSLQVRSAIAIGNYSKLFQLYNEAPNMSAYLMDLFIPRERSSALITILKAYRPSISLEFLTKTLAFTSVDNCNDWLKTEIGDDSQQIISNQNLDCKSALAAILSK